MNVIPMEDLVLQKEAEIKDYQEKEKLVFGKPEKYPPNFKPASVVHQAKSFKQLVAYANFLKTPMRIEHFRGRAAVVSIDQVGVLEPAVSNSNINLLFVPDEDNENWPGTFSVGAGATFSSLSRYPGVKLTEHGVKLIFG